MRKVGSGAEAERWLQRHHGGWRQEELPGQGLLVTAYAGGMEREEVSVAREVESALVRAVNALAAAFARRPS
jgi:hypothetical protein